MADGATNDEMTNALEDALASDDVGLSQVSISPGQKTIQRHSPDSIVRALNMLSKITARASGIRRARVRVYEDT